MTIIRPSFGSMANWTLEPPVSTPTSRRIAIAASRMIWYSLSVSVCAGATVIESPVCTPIGSTFSVEHTMMQLSLRSRTTSISNSFQPSNDSSINSSCVGEKSRPRLHISTNSSLLYAMPPPVPPNVNDGRMTAGKPMSACTSSACSRLCAMPERAEPSPMRVIAALNFSRSSALSIAFFDAPISSTSNLLRTPSRARSSAQLSAVCPPIVGSSASGRSRSMIFAIIGQVIGSM